MHIIRVFSILLVLSLLIGLAPAAQSQAGAPELTADLQRKTGGAVRIDTHAETGRVNFIGTDAAHPIPLSRTLAADASAEAITGQFLAEYGALFGITNPSAELTVRKTKVSPQGAQMVRYQQLYRGVPVMGAELIVLTDGRGQITTAIGEFLPEIKLDVNPGVDAATARAAAIQAIAAAQDVDAALLRASEPMLTIFNPAIVGGPGARISRLAWRVEVTAADLLPIRELALVDAARGGVFLHFNQIDTVLSRKVYDNQNNYNYGLPGPNLARAEGQPPHPTVAEVNYAYDFSGETYQYYLLNEGRDSIDNAGMELISTVNYCPDVSNCPYLNAFWDGSQMVYGQNFAGADDVVAHELTHGVTEHESNLFYYYQSGAINETLSDIFGEFADQIYNSRNTDQPAYRWQLGEDLVAGGIRNMQNPTLFSDPDKVTSAFFDCDPYFEDNGGVHTNSGVGNKAAFLMTDGGSFNGQGIIGLGLTKVSKIWYYTNAYLLHSAADFKDLYNALPQACNLLVGTNGISPTDCMEVSKAVQATEMHLQPTGGCAIPVEPSPCGSWYLMDVWKDDFNRNPLTNWGVGSNAGSNRWYLGNFYATSNQNHLWGDVYNPNNNTADYYIFMTTGVTLPPGKISHLAFNHAWDFEFAPGTYYDGGLVEYSVDGGITWFDAYSLFSHNPPNITLSSGNGNPLQGKKAFGAMSFGYTTSQLNLGTLIGQTVRFRFRIGTDSTDRNYYGWFIDDMHIFYCVDPATLTSKVYVPFVKR